MLESIAKCIGILIMAICLVLFDLWICFKLWALVMVPIFDLPTLTMYQIFWVRIALKFLMPTRVIHRKKS